MIAALPGRSPLARPAPSGGGRLLPQLDALRGAAILAVFVQHLGDRFGPFFEAQIDASVPRSLAPWLLTTFHHAWWGVDLFFVLSGFSLAQSYVRAFAAGRAPPPPRVFLGRRARRILPAFYAALAVIVVTHPGLVSRPHFFEALLANLALLQGYVRPGGLVLLGAAWSLTTEAHFYLLFPWMARPLLDRDRGPRRLLFLAAICVFVWGSRGALHAIFLEPGTRTALLEDSQRRWITSRLDQFARGLRRRAPRGDHELGAREGGRAMGPLGVLVAVAALPLAFRLEGALYLSRRLVALCADVARHRGARALRLALRGRARTLA
ncbi:MAG: acyltransferase [Byssovorax sp.]